MVMNVEAHAVARSRSFSRVKSRPRTVFADLLRLYFIATQLFNVNDALGR